MPGYRIIGSGTTLGAPGRGTGDRPPVLTPNFIGMRNWTSPQSPRLCDNVTAGGEEGAGLPLVYLPSAAAATCARRHALWANRTAEDGVVIRR
jgi:hypothetical protein